MFQVLMASQPVRTGWLSSTAFSTVTHGTLIAAALMSTGKIASSVHEARETMIQRVTYVLPRAPEVKAIPRNAIVSTTAKEPAAKKEVPSVPDFAGIQDAIDKTIEVPNIEVDLDLSSMLAEWLTKPDALSTPGPDIAEILMARGALIRPENGLYTSDNVEVSVAPKSGNPLPRYPTALRDMGVEGSFVVHFVVDSTGKVPDDKIDFPSSMHRLFADAVRTALRRSRYFPARIGGQPVAQLVAQEFRFEVRDR
jgi:TonB family protein